MIRSGSVVAAGAVVREGQLVGPGVLMTGVPAAVKRSLTENEQRLLRQPASTYEKLAREHLSLMESILRGGE